jgi:hypothetical protein
VHAAVRAVEWVGGIGAHGRGLSRRSTGSTGRRRRITTATTTCSPDSSRRWSRCSRSACSGRGSSRGGRTIAGALFFATPSRGCTGAIGAATRRSNFSTSRRRTTRGSSAASLARDAAVRGGGAGRAQADPRVPPSSTTSHWLRQRGGEPGGAAFRHAGDDGSGAAVEAKAEPETNQLQLSVTAGPPGGGVAAPGEAGEGAVADAGDGADPRGDAGPDRAGDDGGERPLPGRTCSSSWTGRSRQTKREAVSGAGDQRGRGGGVAGPGAAVLADPVDGSGAAAWAVAELEGLSEEVVELKQKEETLVTEVAQTQQVVTNLSLERDELAARLEASRPRSRRRSGRAERRAQEPRARAREPGGEGGAAVRVSGRLSSTADGDRRPKPAWQEGRRRRADGGRLRSGSARRR